MLTFQAFLNQSRSISAYLLATASLSLVSCSHLPVTEFPNTANPGEEINRLEADQREARAIQTDVLAPTYFQASVAKLEEAKADRSKDGDNKDVLAVVAAGRAQLDKAKEVGKVSRLSLEDVVKARADAQAAGVENYKSKEFAAADSNLKDMTKDIEGGDLKSAEAGRDELKGTYLALELASIKINKLRPAEVAITSAKKEGAEKDAVRTLAIAQKSFDDANAYITNNRHDTVGIQARADGATASADRLLKMTRDAKVTGNKDSESIILESEAQQKKVADGDAALAKDQVALTSQLGTVAALQGQKQDLEAQKQGLEADKAFNARIESIRARFTANEAEVFMDGSQVLIRMKGLAFPTGKSMITAANFPLLGKVQLVSQDLGNGPITVNGHTDAVGAKSANLKLSTDRAEAVKAYLVSTGKIPETSITAIGYGDTMPISTNKTAVGRGENRRVDVLIAPDRARMTH